MSEEIMFADGFDECIIGVMDYDGNYRVVYDKWAMVLCMRNSEPDLTFDDCVEFLEYNVWGAYVGPSTPIYLRLMDGDPQNRREEVMEYMYDNFW